MNTLFTKATLLAVLLAVSPILTGFVTFIAAFFVDLILRTRILLHFS